MIVFCRSFRDLFSALISFRLNDFFRIGTGWRDCKIMDFKSVPMKISSNYYVDMIEIPNLSYHEFLFWTRSVYGAGSQNYNSVYPDNSTWKDLTPEPVNFLTDFTSPAYRFYPVLCISNAQAKSFSDWRSDRVMEYILVREKVIKRNKVPGVHPDSVFTIKMYFTGKYRGMKPNPKVVYYPDFQVPDSAFYSQLPAIADAIYDILFSYTPQIGFRNLCSWKKWE
jgi:hypothetical protein